MNKENIIRKKSFDFALKIIELYTQLVENNEFVISRQLLRSGTSIGANVEEASSAQSKKDFISRMPITSKEAHETRYWLRLLQESTIIKLTFNLYLEEVEEIIKILTSIVKTSKERL